MIASKDVIITPKTLSDEEFSNGYFHFTDQDF